MLVEFSTFPMGKEGNMSKPVAEVIDLIDKSGLPYECHAMGTLVEGEWDEVMELVKKCHSLLAGQYNRVSTRIIIDDRKDASGRIAGKLDSVEKQLGRKFRR